MQKLLPAVPAALSLSIGIPAAQAQKRVKFEPGRSSARFRIHAPGRQLMEDSVKRTSYVGLLRASGGERRIRRLGPGGSAMTAIRHAVSMAVAACALSPVYAAEAPYPSRPIRLIVPYPPAGTTDFVAREVANNLSQSFGQSVVIDNRPGGGTLLGLSLGAKAPRDGYTITFGTSAGLAVSPALGVKMPYDPLRDFAPIGLMVYVPFLLVVNAEVPARNVKELIDLAKAQPGKLNFASPGVGTPNHLGIELLNMLAGVKFVHVPYKGGALAVNDLVAGRVQVLFSGLPQVGGMMKAGRLRAIAVATPRPSRVADLPPIADIYPGFDANTWYGLLAPAGTPAAAVSKFSAALNTALVNPAVVQRLLDQGVEATPGSPAVFRELIVSETARWRKVIKTAGISAEAAQ